MGALCGLRIAAVSSAARHAEPAWVFKLSALLCGSLNSRFQTYSGCQACTVSKHAGVQSATEAILSARGDIRGPNDRDALNKLEADGKLGYSVDDVRMLAADVDMALGSAKEGFAVLAAVQALQPEWQGKELMLQETGFTSCAASGDRCAVRLVFGESCLLICICSQRACV